MYTCRVTGPLSCFVTPRAVLWVEDTGLPAPLHLNAVTATTIVATVVVVIGMACSRLFVVYDIARVDIVHRSISPYHPDGDQGDREDVTPRSCSRKRDQPS